VENLLLEGDLDFRFGTRELDSVELIAGFREFEDSES